MKKGVGLINSRCPQADPRKDHQKAEIQKVETLVDQEEKIQEPRSDFDFGGIGISTRSVLIPNSFIIVYNRNVSCSIVISSCDSLQDLKFIITARIIALLILLSLKNIMHIYSQI